MKLTTLETAEKVPFNLDGRKMYSGEKVELVHIALNPKEEIALHTNPFDVIFFVVEGEGELLLENLSNKITPSTTVYIEKDKQRGLRNSSNSLLRVLVFKIF